MLRNSQPCFYPDETFHCLYTTDRIRTETVIFMYFFSPRTKSSFPCQTNILAVVSPQFSIFMEPDLKQYLAWGGMTLFMQMQDLDNFSRETLLLFHKEALEGNNEFTSLLRGRAQGKRLQPWLECSPLGRKDS